MSHDRIQYSMVIEGVVTPAFIHNGPCWFFVDVPVYENGLVDCWEMVDLALLETKLASGWLTPRVPDGEWIRIYDLGSWPISGGRWSLDANGLRARIHALVRRSNPQMRNLYDCHGETVRVVNGIRVVKLGTFARHPVRSDDPAGLRVVRGKAVDAWWIDEGTTYLASVRVFADGNVEIGRVPTPCKLTLEETKAFARSGRLITEPTPGTSVAIHELGTFVLGTPEYATTVDDFVLQLEDEHALARGVADSVDRCRRAYEAYEAAPSEALRDALRIAYEAVPTHRRMFVGDMDTKDVPIRMVIYGDEELENWSHRIVARARGIEPLPSIRVPKPRAPG